jgi:hypothetical protein
VLERAYKWERFIDGICVADYVSLQDRLQPTMYCLSELIYGTYIFTWPLGMRRRTSNTEAVVPRYSVGVYDCNSL